MLEVVIEYKLLLHKMRNNLDRNLYIFSVGLK